MQLARTGRDRGSDGNLPAPHGGTNGMIAPLAPAVTSVTDGRDDSLLEVVWRQRVLVAASAALAVIAAVGYLMVATPKYTTSARIYVQKASPALLNDAGRSGGAEQASDNYRYTQCELLRSTPIIALALGGPGMDELSMFDGVRNRINFLKDQLSADVGKRDDIITLSMTWRDRDEAAKVIDGVVEAYIAYQSNEKRSSAAEVTDILRKEKAKRDAELAAKAEEVRQFQRANKTLSFDSGGNGAANVTMHRLSSLSEALTAAHLNTVAAKTAYEQCLKAAGMTDEQAAASDVVALSASDEERIRAELFAVEQRLGELKRQYLPSHPVVRAVEARAAQLNASLVSVVRQRWMVAQFHEVELQKSFDEQQKLAIELTAKAAEYERLSGELTRLQELSDTLDNRIKELAVIEEAGALNISVVEPASSTDTPASPDKGKVLAGALVAGLMLGAAFGLLREWVNPRLGSAEDVKAALGLNPIGALPRMPAGQSCEARAWAVHLAPTSEAAEAFRAVRTAVLYAAPDGRSRTILVTSPAAGEGKTTLASNLAIALAKAGKRVLIVDTNFRSPALHRIFGIADEPGLGGVLAAEESVERAVRRTAVERLDVLPAGSAPVGTDPSELLNSESFATVIDGLYESYDHVVLDAPAVTAVDDARIVAASCDVTLLVMRLDKSNRRLAERARDGLVSVGAHVLGAVINDAPRRAAAITAHAESADVVSAAHETVVQRIAAGLDAEQQRLEAEEAGEAVGAGEALTHTVRAHSNGHHAKRKRPVKGVMWDDDDDVTSARPQAS